MCAVGGALVLAGCGGEGPVVEEALSATTEDTSPTATQAPPADDETTTTDTPGDDTGLTSAPGGDATTSAAPPAEDSPSEDSPSAAPTGSIRDTDFADLTFTDTWTGQEVTLEQGTATIDTDGFPTRYTLQEDPDFADVDGDGAEDALVRIFAEQGNGWADYTYVYLWDEETAGPRQVLPAITDDARCGNVTTEIVPEDGVITVDYLDRSVNFEACAEQPSVEATRTVKVVDGYAFEIEPHLSALLYCGAIGAEPAPPENTGLPDGSIRAYPDDAAMALIDLDETYRLSMPEEGMRTDPAHPGWTIIQFILPGQDTSAFERQCGWLRTD